MNPQVQVQPNSFPFPWQGGSPPHPNEELDSLKQSRMGFISLCSAEILFVTSLTSSSPKPFRLWEDKSWLWPLTDYWQLLQLLQAWLTQEQVKTTPCCHLKHSWLLPRQYHVKIIMCQDVVEQPPRCEHERHPRALGAVLVCALFVFPLRSASF